MFTTQKIADTYDQIALNFSATRPKLSAEAISLLPSLAPGASVLDLGCGNGVLLTAFDRRSLGEGGPITYIGLDISPALLKAATGLHPEGRFELADITAPSTWANLPQFDFIAALAVLHHLSIPDDHIKLFRNIKQHLKPNGICLISVWRLDQPKFDRFRTDSRHLSIPFHGGPKRDFYTFAEDEISDLCRQTGFSQIKTTKAKENLYLILRP